MHMVNQQGFRTLGLYMLVVPTCCSMVSPNAFNMLPSLQRSYDRGNTKSTRFMKRDPTLGYTIIPLETRKAG